MKTKTCAHSVVASALFLIISSSTLGQEPRPDIEQAPHAPTAPGPAALAPTAAGDTPPPKIINGVPPGFELVRLTNDPTMQHSIPDINDRGEVVFEKFIPGTGDRNIYLFSEGAFRKITGDETIDWKPVINNASQIVWNSGTDLESLFGLESTDEGVQIPGEYRFFSSKDINEAGDVVWSHFDEASGNIDVFHYDRGSGEVRKITDGGNNQSARINNNGQIVWRARDDSINPWTSRVILYTDGETTSIAPGECQCQSTDINDAGHVVWKDSIGLYFWDGHEVRLIAPIAATAHVNNRDEIGFAIWDFELNRAVHAIFTDGFVYTLPDFGMTSARSAINDRGEMVMRHFDDRNGHMELFLLRRIAPKGDNDHDCRIDLADYGQMQVCAHAVPGPEGTLLADCVRFDFDDDGDIDITDFSCFFDESTGPDRSVDECTP